MSITAYNMIPMASSALVQCSDNLARLRYAWLSLLCPPGAALWHDECGPYVEQLRYVMSACEYGILHLTTVHEKLGGKTVIKLMGSTSKVEYKHVVITSIAGWMCADMGVLPPVALPEGSPPAILLEVLGQGVPLLQAAAKEAVSSYRGFQFALPQDTAILNHHRCS